ncbi:MAG TPA: DUF92 domain-containing protein [Mucilaginibacter sp.]|jgi:uncharacterized protein (TIGR00297 family)|nr:DUF92 domain-containing protein [Mucilaginibacter sp.]
MSGLYHYLPFILLLTVIVIASIVTRKLTIWGALTGAAIAILIFFGSGYTGIIMLATFFILGTVATMWGKKEKSFIKIQQDQSTKRNAGQVLANGGVASLTCILIYLFPEKAGLFKLMMAGSLASAMADTLSSELGMIYGRRFYNILTFKSDQKGLDGVVSMEGTLIGILGSVFIAIIYAIGFGWDNDFVIIIVAGTIGNMADSILGALWERKHYLTNDAVNFLNTLIAAMVAGLIWLLC